MGKRLFEEGEYTIEARKVSQWLDNKVAGLIEEIEEQTGPLDLRDLHFLFVSAVGMAVAKLSVSRRLRGE